MPKPSLAAALAGIMLATLAMPAAAQQRPDQKAFFMLYRELVETNTVLN